MSFLRRFFAGEQEVQPAETQIEKVEEVRPEVKAQDFIDKSNPNGDTEEEIQSFDYGCGLPIDAIYIYIEKDWEKKGREDATLCSDIQYMEAKLNIIREGLKRRFEMTRNKYKIKIMTLQGQKENAQKLGILGSVNDMDIHIEICKEHLERIDLMEKQLVANDPSMMSMMESYKRGFQIGVANKIKDYINNK